MAPFRAWREGENERERENEREWGRERVGESGRARERERERERERDEGGLAVPARDLVPPAPRRRGHRHDDSDTAARAV